MPLPSVLLHDHLDGGLRPSTVVELAREVGYRRLPHEDPSELAIWFDQSDSGSLEGYLAAFEHTIAVMQTAEALEWVAYEAGLDLADDGVVYAESRFCPALHTQRGLEPVEVIGAVARGLARAQAETGLRWGIIIDALRQLDHSSEMAQVAVRSRHLGVVGFDLAGPEATFPPADHLAAFRFARESGLRVSIHAGESGGGRGPANIASAMDVCGAERIGHGIEIVEDCILENGEIVKLGAVAERVLDRQMPLEICVSSNLATKGIDIGRHPVGALYRAGFNVTLSTDNRLMSGTSMSLEIELVEDHHGFKPDDLALTARRSLAAAFCDHETKRSLWERIIAPAYAAAGARVDEKWS